MFINWVIFLKDLSIKLMVFMDSSSLNRMVIESEIHLMMNIYCFNTY